MRLILGLLFSCVVLTGCSGEGSSPSTDSATVVTADATSTIVVSNAQIRPPLPGRNIAAAYFRLDSAVGDRLVSVSSPVSARVEIHNHIDDNGILRMREVTDGVAIPANGSTEFRPGGYHVMLFGAAITDETTDVALTLDFETGADVTVIAEILGASNDDHQAYGSGGHHGGDDKKSHGSGH